MVRPSLDPVYPKENGVANDEFSVRSIVSSNISADLCEIDIVLATEDGLRRVCKINPDVLAELLINLSDLAQHVRNQIVARFGELTIAALGADAVAASSPTGSGKIIMSIQSRTGTVHSYPRFFDLKCETRKNLRTSNLADEACSGSDALPAKVQPILDQSAAARSDSGQKRKGSPAAFVVRYDLESGLRRLARSTRYFCHAAGTVPY